MRGSPLVGFGPRLNCDVLDVPLNSHVVCNYFDSFKSIPATSLVLGQVWPQKYVAEISLRLYGRKLSGTIERVRERSRCQRARVSIISRCLSPLIRESSVVGSLHWSCGPRSLSAAWRPTAPSATHTDADVHGGQSGGPRRGIACLLYVRRASSGGIAVWCAVLLPQTPPTASDSTRAICPARQLAARPAAR